MHESGKSHGSTARAGPMSKWPPLSDNSMSKTTVKVVVFHCRFAPGSLCVLGCGSGSPLRHDTHTCTPLSLSLSAVGPTAGSAAALTHGEREARRGSTVFVVVALTSHLCYTPHVVAQYQTRVKLNRVFFPR